MHYDLITDGFPHIEDLGFDACLAGKNSEQRPFPRPATATGVENLVLVSFPCTNE